MCQWTSQVKSYYCLHELGFICCVSLCQQNIDHLHHCDNELEFQNAFLNISWINNQKFIYATTKLCLQTETRKFFFEFLFSRKILVLFGIPKNGSLHFMTTHHSRQQKQEKKHQPRNREIIEHEILNLSRYFFWDFFDENFKPSTEIYLVVALINCAKKNFILILPLRRDSQQQRQKKTEIPKKLWDVFGFNEEHWNIFFGYSRFAIDPRNRKRKIMPDSSSHKDDLCGVYCMQIPKQVIVGYLMIRRVLTSTLNCSFLFGKTEKLFRRALPNQSFIICRFPFLSELNPSVISSEKCRELCVQR